MKYFVYFDLIRDGLPWSIILFSAVAIILSLFVYTWGRNQNTNKLAAVALSIGGTLFIVLSLINYYYYRQILDRQEYLIAEGKIYDFNLENEDGKQGFKVDSVQFEYSGRTLTSTYHKLRSQGSILQDGQDVRITYSRSMMDDSTKAILRIEIGE